MGTERKAMAGNKRPRKGIERQCKATSGQGKCWVRKCVRGGDGIGAHAVSVATAGLCRGAIDLGHAELFYVLVSPLRHCWDAY